MSTSAQLPRTWLARLSREVTQPSRRIPEFDIIPTTPADLVMLSGINDELLVSISKLPNELIHNILEFLVIKKLPRILVYHLAEMQTEAIRCLLGESEIASSFWPILKDVLFKTVTFHYKHHTSYTNDFQRPLDLWHDQLPRNALKRLDYHLPIRHLSINICTGQDWEFLVKEICQIFPNLQTCDLTRYVACNITDQALDSGIGRDGRPSEEHITSVTAELARTVVPDCGILCQAIDAKVRLTLDIGLNNPWFMMDVWSDLPKARRTIVLDIQKGHSSTLGTEELMRNAANTLTKLVVDMHSTNLELILDSWIAQALDPQERDGARSHAQRLALARKTHRQKVQYHIESQTGLPFTGRILPFNR